MRILLIIIQTAAFLTLAAAILLWLLPVCVVVEGNTPPPSIFSHATAFVFGSWIVNALIFIILAAANIWLVLGPLMKVEDPMRRTLQHLCIVVIQAMFLIAVLGFAIFFLSTDLL